MFHPDYWHWLILGIVLLGLEVFFPGAFFLWMGLAGLVLGGVVLIFPHMGWELQAVIFSVLSLVAIFLGRAWLRRRPVTSAQPLLNQRGRQYIGRQFTLKEPIINGDGKIRVDDSIWKVRGADCPAGSKVEVIGVDGTVLLVKVA
jgi:membrane protein implicated in regulation of membrane protease activity